MPDEAVPPAPPNAPRSPGLDPIDPPLAPLRAVLGALDVAGIEAALGGSGLLHALGLVDAVRDWDLTTDVPLGSVAAALAASGLPWADAALRDGPYATAYRLLVNPGGGEVDVDVMGRFAVRPAAGAPPCHLPTVVRGWWHGVPLGSPEVWAVAYRLMGRHPKAELLLGHLRRHGADPAIVRRLLAEPLPAPIRDDLTDLPLTARRRAPLSRCQERGAGG